MQLPENVQKFLEKPNFAVLATVSPKGRRRPRRSGSCWMARKF